MNSDIIKGILLFLGGTGTGAAVAGLVFKKKYNKLEAELEEQYQKDLEESREVYEEALRERTEKFDYELSSSEDEQEIDETQLAELSNRILDNAERAKNKPALINQVRRISEKENYVSYSGKRHDEPERNEVPEDVIEPLEAAMDEIEIIAPNEYGDMGDYDCQELYYLRDGVLVDDEGIPIEDVRSMIGPDALNEFGTFEPDAVYVRNNRRGIDFAIFLKEDMTSSNFTL